MDSTGFHKGGGIAHVEEAKCTLGERKEEDGNNDGGCEPRKPEAPSGSGRRYEWGVCHKASISSACLPSPNVDIL